MVKSRWNSKESRNPHARKRIIRRLPIPVFPSTSYSSNPSVAIHYCCCLLYVGFPCVQLFMFTIFHRVPYQSAYDHTQIKTSQNMSCRYTIDHIYYRSSNTRYVIRIVRTRYSRKDNSRFRHSVGSFLPPLCGAQLSRKIISGRNRLRTRNINAPTSKHVHHHSILVRIEFKGKQGWRF